MTATVACHDSLVGAGPAACPDRLLDLYTIGCSTPSSVTLPEVVAEGLTLAMWLGLDGLADQLTAVTDVDAALDLILESSVEAIYAEANAAPTTTFTGGF